MSYKETGRQITQLIKGERILREVYDEVIQFQAFGTHRAELLKAITYTQRAIEEFTTLYQEELFPQLMQTESRAAGRSLYV